jgi:hypothetical protein
VIIDRSGERAVRPAVVERTLPARGMAMKNVSDKTKTKILWDNCARLYSLA